MLPSAIAVSAGGGCDQRPGVGGWDPLFGLSYPFRASLFRAVAAEIAEAKLAEYEEPEMDEGLKEQLQEFVSRRRTELGD